MFKNDCITIYFKKENILAIRFEFERTLAV